MSSNHSPVTWASYLMPCQPPFTYFQKSGWLYVLGLLGRLNEITPAEHITCGRELVSRFLFFRGVEEDPYVIYRLALMLLPLGVPYFPFKVFLASF